MGAALERRVFMTSGDDQVFANMFVLLVTPPGVGKTQAIKRTSALLHKMPHLKVAPDDVTKASLLDHLVQAGQTRLGAQLTDMPLTYHSLQICADELGVLIPAHDLAFMSTMNALYDNRDRFKESRRGRDGDITLTNPQISLLAGTQPDFLASLLPPEAWGMGFMSRMIMVYEGKKVHSKLFTKAKPKDWTPLELDLKTIAELRGELIWSEEAKEAMVAWYESGMKPEPEHSKLKHYVPRRLLHIFKLAMISSAARSNSMLITEDDFFRARDWLVEVEARMPEIFKDMAGAPDHIIITDLHSFMWQEWQRNKKPIHISRIQQFLMQRTPSYNIDNLLKSCKTAKVIIEVGPDHYQPGLRNDTGEFG